MQNDLNLLTLLHYWLFYDIDVSQNNSLSFFLFNTTHYLYLL